MVNTSIFKYDDHISLDSQLNPIEDLLDYMSLLKSKEYTRNLLVTKYGFIKGKELNETIKLISLYINTGIGLAEQAIKGPKELSFLPLYYSSLNLFKVWLLMLGKRGDLLKNKLHGAKYNENQIKKNFLNEEITLYKKGTIPLIYETINKKKIPKTGYKVKIDDCLSTITFISGEYGMLTGNKHNFFGHFTSIIEDDTNGHYIKITPSYKQDKVNSKHLKAYKGLKIIEEGGNYFYITDKIKGNFEIVKKQLLRKINKDLISPYLQKNGFGGNWCNLCSITSKRYLFNEELAILLSYFHLGNIVRYNPEHLMKLTDSKYWPIILSLRNHGYYRFLLLMWGNYNKQCFDV